MSNKQNDIFEEELRELHEEAGLIFTGRDEDGEPTWLGSDRAWQKFNSLTNKNL